MAPEYNEHPGASQAYAGDEALRVESEADANERAAAEDNDSDVAESVKTDNGPDPESPHLGSHYEPGSATKPSPGFETVV